MTIPIIYGDILNEDFGIIVHGVSAQGKMGSGIALQIKKKYPKAYYDYMNLYLNAQKDLKVGEAVLTDISPQLKIITGVTQLYYGRDPNVVYVNYNAVGDIFRRINYYALASGLPVKFPKIGCGLANGDWTIIEAIIEDRLARVVSRTLFIWEDNNGV